MRRITLIASVFLLGLPLQINAQLYIKIDTSFHSTVLGEEKPVNVYLPLDYYENPSQQYAVIYYLHGAGGDQNSGHQNALIYYTQHYLDTATITSPPAIYVCPDGSCQPYHGSMYVNSVLYGNYEDYFMQDVIGFTESSFRIMPGKDFRFITGFSMGGSGSAWMSVNYPEMFRATFPYIGFMSWPDTTLEAWKYMCYIENGSYNLDYTAGLSTQLLFTACGAYLPNLNLPPWYIEIPFDTNGIWVDTILDKWYAFDVSRLLTGLPGSDELAWFLGCGTEDYMVTYPTYQVLMDSMDAHGMEYDTCFFEGGHVLHPPTWKTGMHWMDSIINLSFLSMGRDEIILKQINPDVFPNPVTEAVQLTYILNQPASVRVEILNMTGSVLIKMDQGLQTSGKHTLSPDIRHLAAGIYLVRLQAGDQTVVKRIVKL
jgi:S-formylglutathione hydrolase FrmB